MVFDLPIRGDKVKPQQVTALHLFCSLAFIGTGAIIYVYNFQITYWGLALLLAGLLMAALTVGRNKWVTSRYVNVAFRVIELLISLSMLTLSLIEQWKFPIGIFSVLSAAIAFSIFWERGAGQQLYIRIDEGGLRMPVTSRRRSIPWQDVERVLLRYGILSIDCTDNKLYQVEVSDTSGIDIEVFEAFCNARIAEGIEKRPKNDW
ncbi:hypothetical protein GCM10023093_01360 [Nemorincola caseinilytica]|uniref:DUF5673 domain-containing protein n=1 Tax=Nemorincola caseinilytica TaxID=2054315 RepID=A0ABP8N4M0_9BACT